MTVCSRIDEIEAEEAAKASGIPWKPIAIVATVIAAGAILLYAAKGKARGK